MKKFFAVVTVVLTFAAPVAAFAALGSFDNDGTSYDGRIVVITDSRGGTEVVSSCGGDFLEYKAVIINPGGGPAIITTVGINPSEVVNTGDRFDIQQPSACNGRIHAILIRK